MYIPKKLITVILKILIGLISMVLLGVIFSEYGPYTIRIFPAWVLLIAAIYFPVSAIVLALSPRQFNGKIICPMLEGLLLLNFFLMSFVALASNSFHFYLPTLPSWTVWLTCLVLPLLILADWLLFVKKGAWRPISPLYWLALPVCYAATMIFLTQILPDDSELRFPLEIFNFLENGLLPMFGWIFVILVLSLVAGYLLYLIDYTMSGKLAQKILLPHLQVVEIDENGNEIIIDQTQSASAKPAQPEVAAASEPENSPQPQVASSKTIKTPPQPEVAPTKTPRTSKSSKNSQNFTQSKTRPSSKSKSKTQDTPQPEIIKVEVTKVDSSSNPKNAQNLHSHNLHSSDSKTSRRSKTSKSPKSKSSQT